MGTESAVISNSEANSLSEMETKIINQVEYYFGNYNLRRDKFMKEKMKDDNGWISLETLVTFNRLKILSSDIAVIASALKKSTNKLIEVSDDEKKVRRRTDNPLPEIPDFRKELDEKTVYVKGLSVKSTLDELLKFFKEYGTIESVYMKKNIHTKLFKGSVFVTFATSDDAENFLKLENVKYNHADVLKESKLAYIKRKQMQFEQRKAEKDRKKKSKDETTKDEPVVTKDESQVAETLIEKGCILKLSGLSENTMWEHIKEVFYSHGAVAYVDYSKGKPEGYVRFEKPIAEEVMNKVIKEEDGIKKVTICNAEAIAVVLEGDEEVEYLEKVSRLKSEMKHKMNNKRGNRGQNHGKHFRGGGRKQFGKRNRHSDKKEGSKESNEERPQKIQKVE